MAEETSTEQSDFEKVQGYLQEQVQTLFKGEMERYTTEQQQAQQRQATGLTPEQQQQQALREYLNPVIQPELQAVRLEAADAKDLTGVLNDPLYQEYSKEVEDLVQQTRRVNRQMPRKDLLRYVMGKEMEENPTKFKERLAAREKEQLDRAAMAADMGSANIARNPAALAATAAEFAKLPVAEMEKYLEGVTF